MQFNKDFTCFSEEYLPLASVQIFKMQNERGESRLTIVISAAHLYTIHQLFSPDFREAEAEKPMSLFKGYSQNA